MLSSMDLPDHRRNYMLKEVELIPLLIDAQSPLLPVRGPAEYRLSQYQEVPGFMISLIYISRIENSSQISQLIQQCIATRQAAVAAGGPTAAIGASAENGYSYHPDSLRGMEHITVDAIRSMAIIIVKNAIPMFWKVKVIQDEKKLVRASLIEMVGSEPLKNIASIVSVIIAKIARFDCPTKWPALLNVLVQKSMSPDHEPQMFCHALLTMKEVFKEMGSKRLPGDKEAYGSKTPEVFHGLYKIFLESLDKVIAIPVNTHQDRLNQDPRYLRTKLSLKCMRMLLDHGLGSTFMVNEQISSLFTVACTKPEIFFYFRNPDYVYQQHRLMAIGAGAAGAGASNHHHDLSTIETSICPYVLSTLTKHLAKFVLVLCRKHALQFLTYMPPFVQQYGGLLFVFDSSYHLEKCGFLAASLFRDIVVSLPYQSLALSCEDEEVVELIQTNMYAVALNARLKEAVEELNDEYRTGGYLESLKIIQDLVQKETGWTLVEALVKRIFKLKKSELNSWTEDPERYVHEEEAADWGGGDSLIRPVCENLFSTIVVRNPLISGRLLAMTEKVAAECGAAWNQFLAQVSQLNTEYMATSQWNAAGYKKACDSILLPFLFYDACLRAVSLASYDLSDKIPFSNWFSTQFAPLMQLKVHITTDGSSIPIALEPPLALCVVKARAASLVSKLVLQIGREVRHVIYDILVSLMRPDEADIVVALSCSRALHFMVDDLAFDSAEFGLLLQPTIDRIFRLVVVCKETDSKQQLLYFVTALIETCSRQISIEIINAMAQHLPVVWNSVDPSNDAIIKASISEKTRANYHSNYASNWDDDEDDNGYGDDQENYGGADTDGEKSVSHLRSTIITLLRRMLEALSEQVFQSDSMSQLIYSAIQNSVDLSCSDSSRSDFLMDYGLELWIATVHASRQYTSALDSLFSYLITIMNRNLEYLAPGMRLIDSYILLGSGPFFEKWGPQLVAVMCPIFGNVRDRGSLALAETIEYVLLLLPRQHMAMFSPVFVLLFQQATNSKESVIVRSSFLAIVCRIALISIDLFHSLLLQTGGSEATPQSLSEMICELVGEVCSRSEDMYLTSRRKLAGLAVCNILVHYIRPYPALFEKLPQVLESVNCVLNEISEEQDARDNILSSELDETYRPELSGGLSAYVQNDNDDRDPVGRSPSLESLRISPDAARRNTLAETDPVADLNLAIVVAEMLKLLQTIDAGALNLCWERMSNTSVEQLREHIKL